MKRFKIPFTFHDIKRILLSFSGGFFLCLFINPSNVIGQQFPFESGEIVEYEISYNWGFIWVDAGEVSFSVSNDEAYGKSALKLTGEGQTYPKYDWFYKVRDLYESKVDGENLRPYSFIRNVQEGKTTINNAYVFDHQKHKAYSIIKQKDGFLRDTLDFPEETYDVISMIYRSRLIDFEKYQVEDKIPIKLILDNQVYESYIRYLGKEQLDVKGLKNVECYKFKPYLIEGTIFTGGEDMSVFVTADENKVPLYIESKILVGNIKAIVKSTSNLIQPINYLEEE